MLFGGASGLCARLHGHSHEGADKVARKSRPTMGLSDGERKHRCNGVQTVARQPVGLGEAVYRFAFLDFDGATDRLPIEMLFGLLFAWMWARASISGVD